MKRIFQSLLLCILAIALVASLTACGAYPEEKGTNEERTKIASLDGHLYPTYDLYRFAYLSHKTLYTREGLEGEALHTACDTAAMAEIYRVYALFSLCEKNDIDPFSKAIDKEITALVTEVIEGDDKGNPGYGSFEAYLAALKANYMTDRVGRLYMRFAVCEARLAEKLKASGALKTTDEALTAFYNGESLANVMWAYFSPEMQHYNAPELLASVMNTVKSTTDAEAFYHYAVNYQDMAFNMAEAMKDGMLVGKRQLSLEYAPLTDAIFSLGEGETSGEIRVGYSETHERYGIYIVHRMAKPTLDLSNEAQRAELEECYALDTFYALLEDEAARLAENTRYYDFYYTLLPESIVMQ